ncbi:hypothetical protein B0J17DRAFT_764663 [Rhizoctonia solani]|nr:hypothetical protein B0J17DRAFT_764663 [Rhizoctonia solani]
MSSIIALALFAQVALANPVNRRQVNVTSVITNVTASPTVEPTLTANITTIPEPTLLPNTTANATAQLNRHSRPATATTTSVIPSSTGASDDGGYWLCSFPGAEATATATSEPTTVSDPFPTTSADDTTIIADPTVTDTDTAIPTATDTSTLTVPEVTDTDTTVPTETLTDTDVPTATETATDTDVPTATDTLSVTDITPTVTDTAVVTDATTISESTTEAGTLTDTLITATATLPEPTVTSDPAETVTLAARHPRAQTYTVVGPSTTAVIKCIRVWGRPGRPHYPYPHPHPNFPHYSPDVSQSYSPLPTSDIYTTDTFATSTITDALPAATPVSSYTDIPTTTFGVVG